MKIAVVGTKSASGTIGGAESFYKGLVDSIQEHGHQAELICPICDETSFEGIQKAYVEFYDLNLAEFDGIISTKAPAHLIQHRNHISYMMHTIRVFYDMFYEEYKKPSEYQFSQRNLINKLDTIAFHQKSMRKVFTIGNEISLRLRLYNHIDSEVLYPGLNDCDFFEGDFRHIFLPSRLHRWKRQWILIDAMKYVKSPIKCFIAGTGEDEEEYKKRSGNDERIVFLGRIGNEEIKSYYSNALCVPFTPIHEDFGFVTVEAFRSGKPVITCIDSGEPTYIVKDGISGFVCNPNPQEIAQKIDLLYENKLLAYKLGQQGKNDTLNISWGTTVERLLEALSDGQDE